MMVSLPQEIRTYRQLVDALRARRLELDLSFALLDELAGLATGYSTKVLSPAESRSKHPKLLGTMSLAVILGALGCQLELVEDEQAMEQIKPRLIPRHRRGAMHHAVHHARQPRPAAPETSGARVNGHAA
jgi:hypothetical protein